jgi:hypothetical protein
VNTASLLKVVKISIHAIRYKPTFSGHYIQTVDKAYVRVTVVSLEN